MISQAGTQIRAKKIYVGMSGGVDSSVSAALLKKAGHDVTGVFIKVWQPDWIECNWREERRDAMRAAAHLGIPFVTLDLEKEYKEGVIDYMISEYAAGRTPNPDVMCNREVKFGAFWRWAKEQGADAIATGHYARVVESLRSIKSVKPVFSLLAGVDTNKDQSYFLWTLNQDDLSHILFPVGHLVKSQVRSLAAKFGLPNADKKDSQGLCFIGKIDVKEFLKHYISARPGPVIDETGRTIGIHPGALLFTNGERHGFTITHKTPNDQPYFVIAKDVVANTLTVSNVKVSSITNFIKLIKTNWTRGTMKTGDVISIRTRYRQPLVPARVISMSSSDGGAQTAEIELEKHTDPITPGQSLVAYVGEECVGGGIIV